MAKTATIQTRVDPVVKNNAQMILKKLNISMSEAISMYLSQITLHNGIPFEIKIPNEVTAKTLKDAENGKNVHEVDSVDKLFKKRASLVRTNPKPGAINACAAGVFCRSRFRCRYSAWLFGVRSFCSYNGERGSDPSTNRADPDFLYS